MVMGTQIFNDSDSEQTIVSSQATIKRGLLTPPSTPKRRRYCNASTISSPSPSSQLDRFVPGRSGPNASVSLADAFKAARTTDRLSQDEKLLRHTSASPDPFRPRATPYFGRSNRPLAWDTVSLVSNMSQQRMTTLAIQSGQADLDGQSLQMSTATLQASVPSIRPTSRPVPDGRGGFIRSGSNAPLYESRLLRSVSSEDKLDQMERRLATALDIDQTTRTIRVNSPMTSQHAHSQLQQGIDRKQIHHRRQGLDAGWNIQDCFAKPVLDAPNLRDDFYCSMLAICATTGTIAVGLANDVYLWSERIGVRCPVEQLSHPSETHVTSLSFSSRSGGQCILATGRSSGHLSLWSLLDDERPRLSVQHTMGITCLAFSSVETRRHSGHFDQERSMESLLVGDGNGQVYLYSVEWPDPTQMAIHGWSGSVQLIAKIVGHEQQICGLAWSSDGSYFATGGNDNMCFLFELKTLFCGNERRNHRKPMLKSSPRSASKGIPRSFSDTTALSKREEASGRQAFNSIGSPHISSGDSSLEAFQASSSVSGPLVQAHRGEAKHIWKHAAAVKAIAFCPWQGSLVATGGGSNDRGIHFWHVFSGACLASISVHAQVTSLIWSTTRREIAATFGYAQPEHPYRVAVFSWPGCQQILAIPWSAESRALCAVAYPRKLSKGQRRLGSQPDDLAEFSCRLDADCLVVASSDETVRFHEIWSPDQRHTECLSLSQPARLGGGGILEALEGCDEIARDTELR